MRPNYRENNTFCRHRCGQLRIGVALHDWDGVIERVRIKLGSWQYDGNLSDASKRDNRDQRQRR
jgi:hypothetical protein